MPAVSLSASPIGAGSAEGSGSSRNAGAIIHTDRTRNGIGTRNTHRQLIESARKPPISGPNNPGNSHVVARSARTRGRIDAGNVFAIAVSDNAYAAPLAAPWRNRPATTTSMDGAAAETVSPPTYSAAVTKISGLVPKRSAAAPTIGIVPIIASAAAENAQPYSGRFPRSSRTAGITVATISRCTAPSVSNSSNPTTNRPSRPRNTSRHGAGSDASGCTMTEPKRMPADPVVD